MNQIQRLFDIDPWKISTTTLDTTHRRLQESLTAIGNGYMGMRGNFEEHYSGDHHLGTYFAGVWYPDKTRVGWWKNGYPDYFGKVINGVNFIAVDLKVNDTDIDLAKIPYEDFYLELDMQGGILNRSFTVTVDAAKVRFSFQRFLSIVKKELGALKITAEVLEGTANITMTSKLDSAVTNEDSNYDERFWEELAAGQETEFDYLTVRTIPNNFGIERFTLTAAMKHNASGTYHKEHLQVSETFTWSLTAGETCELIKEVLVVTSRDVLPEEQVATIKGLYQDYGHDYEALKAEQIAAWGKRWELADVTIEGNPAAQQGIRFNLFQLFATYYGEDERLNIGPKGFTGEKYGGATYWDTEAYAVPLYLALAEPDVTKNLLKYRHNQLPGAHINAQRQGLKGALYPMVTFTGVECHNEWEITFEEIHRNGAIAYAIYNYTNYTGDESYLAQEGLEVLVEIARFWADRVHYSKAKDRYMIHGVTGPNEYENNVNNNWYTNTIATWVLRYTLENYRKFAASTTVALTPEEEAKWADIIAKMYYPKDEDLGIFVQHDTFLDKDLMPVTDLNPSDLPLNQNWSWDKILRSCFIKQADVLQGLYFFRDDYTKEELRRNFEFYEPMTVHESSLSACIHAILAADLGLEEKALEMYERTARLDLDNYNNDTEDGLHITSMTGSWLAIVQGFAQMKTAQGKLSFAPFVPQGWDSYSFHINYRGRLLFIQVTKNAVRLELVSGEALELGLYDETITLKDEFLLQR
ncbi:glycoside hydrolase family 65 protein [Enterococcus asini]|uniref:glycoside hydrolase family 65 protein n=1 Tax=Enterococcus asini TaxID=57732 RepID=UPI000E54D39A|nr:glycoside hydrolase family 65 protein [Enterococcus asini]RGW14569.1 glycoside hydrolase family 65 protein [Enterococcus asini]